MKTYHLIKLALLSSAVVFFVVVDLSLIISLATK
jgi:hypothetical protein